MAASVRDVHPILLHSKVSTDELTQVPLVVLVLSLAVALAVALALALAIAVVVVVAVL